MAIEKITSLDVARLAGVSQSAVSRVFTPGASASKRTAARVRAAAEELGYRPNVLARAMITGRSRMVGLVVSYLDNLFYPDALERLSKALQAEGYHVLIFMATNSDEGVDTVLEELLDYQVDAVVMASVSLPNRLGRRCADAGVPVVFFNRCQDDPAFASVTSDNIAGGMKAADHLVACGYRRIAHIAGWEGSSTGRDRASGFREGLRQHGLEPTDQIDGMYRREVASEAVRTLVSSAEPPDAIFVGNDHMAFAVMDTLRHELGRKVPGDVGVMGYDDVNIAAWPGYDLTTVRQPSQRMVEATVRTILSRLSDPEALPKQIKIEGPLVIRGSTRNTEIS